MNTNNATCPFCALACDDLSIKSKDDGLTIPKTLPIFCRTSYQKASQITTTTPRYKNKEISLADASAKAVAMLKRAKHPLFSGLITDIQGMRAVVPLARQCNATLDHIDSDRTLRNLPVLQGYGIVATTLSEIRRRADLLIFIGERIFEDYPRLAQRIYPPKAKHLKSQPKSILVGAWQQKDIPNELKADCEIFHTTADKFPEFIQNLSMQINQCLNNSKQAELPIDEEIKTPYQTLAEHIEQAEYPVFIWSSKDMNYAHADIGISMLAKMVKQINLSKRCASLMLSGNRGAGNMQSVCLWQSGYPGYLSFNPAGTYYNPTHNRSTELLDSGQADLLVWIASIHPEPPPKSKLPTIAFAHPMIAKELQCDLVIPVGIPGIDHCGYSYRTDSVVILPLPKLRDTELPALHELLQDIQLQLSK